MDPIEPSERTEYKLMSYLPSSNSYRSADGCVLAREENSLTPHGNPMGGRWVLRSSDGALVDFDRYRNDLAERNHLDLEPAAAACRQRLVEMLAADPGK